MKKLISLLLVVMMLIPTFAMANGLEVLLDSASGEDRRITGTLSFDASGITMMAGEEVPEEAAAMMQILEELFKCLTVEFSSQQGEVIQESIAVKLSDAEILRLDTIMTEDELYLKTNAIADQWVIRKEDMDRTLPAVITALGNAFATGTDLTDMSGTEALVEEEATETSGANSAAGLGQSMLSNLMANQQEEELEEQPAEEETTVPSAQAGPGAAYGLGMSMFEDLFATGADVSADPMEVDLTELQDFFARMQTKLQVTEDFLQPEGCDKAAYAYTMVLTQDDLLAFVDVLEKTLQSMPMMAALQAEMGGVDFVQEFTAYLRETCAELDGDYTIVEYFDDQGETVHFSMDFTYSPVVTEVGTLVTYGRLTDGDVICHTGSLLITTTDTTGAMSPVNNEITLEAYEMEDSLEAYLMSKTDGEPIKGMLIQYQEQEQNDRQNLLIQLEDLVLGEVVSQIVLGHVLTEDGDVYEAAVLDAAGLMVGVTLLVNEQEADGTYNDLYGLQIWQAFENEITTAVGSDVIINTVVDGEDYQQTIQADVNMMGQSVMSVKVDYATEEPVPVAIPSDAIDLGAMTQEELNDYFAGKSEDLALWMAEVMTKLPPELLMMLMFGGMM